MAKVGPGTKQIMIYIPDELLQKIEDFWHNQKIPNRNAAIKLLIEHGLKEMGSLKVEE